MQEPLQSPQELQLHQVYHQHLCQLNKDLSNLKDHNLQPQQTQKQKRKKKKETKQEVILRTTRAPQIRTLRI